MSFLAIGLMFGGIIEVIGTINTNWQYLGFAMVLLAVVIVALDVMKTSRAMRQAAQKPSSQERKH